MSLKLLIFTLSIFFFSFQGSIVLTIEITELKNSDGEILLELSDAEKNTIKEISQEILNDKCIITIENLSPGEYTFKYFHDANSNKKMDTNFIGMPKEGFGFSNNAMGMFGPPSHRKMLFKIETDTKMKCKAIYLKKK